MPKGSKKHLIFGSTGLVGSAFKLLFKSSVITAGRSNCDYFLDLIEAKDTDKIIGTAGADTIVNFAAYTNVDEAEKQKGDRRGQTYGLNTIVPAQIAESCKKYNKRLIHISTDYVFGGTQDSRPYRETDPAIPVNSWYAQTKRMGEQKIEKIFSGGSGYAIVRISFPYSDKFPRKLDIARTVIETLKQGKNYLGVTDEKIKPTHVKEISGAINLIAAKRAGGIYHVAGSFSKGYITPYDFARKIAGDNGLDNSLIKPITFREFMDKRIAPRPQHTWLDTSKLEKLKNIDS